MSKRPATTSRSRATKKKPAPQRRTVTSARRGKAAAIARAPTPPALTTKAFWPLMDRWGVPDEQALKLLGHPGGLTSTGKRPRFTLTPEEARRLGYLREVGANLELMFGEAGGWLKQRMNALPFQGQTPLEYMVIRGQAGIAEVLRFLARFGLGQALRS